MVTSITLAWRRHAWFTVCNPWIEERPVDLVAQRRFADLARTAVQELSVLVGAPIE